MKLKSLTFSFFYINFSAVEKFGFGQTIGFGNKKFYWIYHKIAQNTKKKMKNESSFSEKSDQIKRNHRIGLSDRN